MCLVLTVVTLALYNPVNSHPFINYDDDRYVTENPHIRQGLTGETFRWALTSPERTNWHPLTWMYHELDFPPFRQNPVGHHFISILLHAVNVVLLLFLLLMWATGRFGPSLFVAALFAFIRSMWSRLPGLQSARMSGARCSSSSPCGPTDDTRESRTGSGIWPSPHRSSLDWPRSRWSSRFHSFCCCSTIGPWRVWRGTSAAAEQTNLTFPWSRLALEKVPLLVISVASAWITMLAQQAGEAIRTTTEVSLSARSATAIYAYAM